MGESTPADISDEETLEHFDKVSWNTRDSILMESGKVDEGMSMLRDVEKRSECPVDKTISCAYLAKGHQMKGGLDATRHWLARAQAINADHVVVTTYRKGNGAIDGKWFLIAVSDPGNQRRL